MEVLAGSPALNTGTRSGAPSTDQRGVPRGSTINLGAYQATANHFDVAGFPSVTLAGQAHSFTVTALDSFGKTAFGYPGTVTFHVSGSALLPTATPLNNGGVFSAALFTPGTQTLMATDGSVSGSEPGILVQQAPSTTVVSVQRKHGTTTLTVTVSGAEGTPTGSVQLFDLFGEKTHLLRTLTLSGGKASLKVKLRPGKHQLKAMYLGDAVYSGSTGAAGVTAH